MESLAELGLVVLRDVLLSVQLMKAVSKGATCFERAEASEFPVLADLCFVLCPESLYVSHFVILALECLLWSLYA